MSSALTKRNLGPVTVGALKASTWHGLRSKILSGLGMSSQSNSFSPVSPFCCQLEWHNAYPGPDWQYKLDAGAIISAPDIRQVIRELIRAPSLGCRFSPVQVDFPWLVGSPPGLLLQGVGNQPLHLSRQGRGLGVAVLVSPFSGPLGA